MIDHEHSNLSVSLDVTQLLAKLGNLQPKSSSCSHIDNPSRRIQLTELDPQRSSNLISGVEKTTSTRLFIAVAYGIEGVVAQLFAFELSNANDSEDEEGECALSLGIGSPEWLDVSKSRVAIDHVSYFNTIQNADITSCAIIPSPVIKASSSARKAYPDNESHERDYTIISQRVSAVVFGTSLGQVFSLILRVSRSRDPPNYAFSLRFDHCKHFNEDVTSFPMQRILHQILPRTKVFQAGEVINASQSSSTIFDGDVEAHVQVIGTHQSESLRKNDCESVSSVSFSRGNSKSCLTKKTRGVTIQMDQDFLWVVYRNGVIVKLPSWKLFLSEKIPEHVNVEAKNVDMENVREADSAAGNPSQSASVIPVNIRFQSPLDIPPPQMFNINTLRCGHQEIDFDEQSSASNISMLSKISFAAGLSRLTVYAEDEFWNLLSTLVTSTAQGHNNEQSSIQPLVMDIQSSPGLIPCVESSRVVFFSKSHVTGVADQAAYDFIDKDENSRVSSLDDDNYGSLSGTVVGGTAALVKGALGIALGAVRWGFGGGAQTNDVEQVDDDYYKDVDDSLEVDVSIQGRGGRFKGCANGTMNIGESVDLMPWPLSNTSLLFSDVPRRLENAVIDPTGLLAATIDNLGRVVLIDLETHQPIRMWKGMRNVSCHFSELRYSASSQFGTKSYLIIHSHMRGSLEVYRLRQGPRVAAVAVPQQAECAVIECLGPPSKGCIVTGFLFEELTEDDGHGVNNTGAKRYILDLIVINDEDGIRSENTKHTTSRHEVSTQLNFLAQLLAPDTLINVDAQKLISSFKTIGALSDLSEGLDLISRSHKIELEVAIEGSSLHSQALRHCKMRLQAALEKESKEGSGTIQKLALSDLSNKISYHEKLVQAYIILHRYELNHVDASKDESDEQDMQPVSVWASEAVSWISSSDEHETFSVPLSVAKRRDELSKPLKFSIFVTAFSSPHYVKARETSEASGVHMSQVKKDRIHVLSRIFRPLLEDVFVFKTVNSIFASLGNEQNFDIQQQYFGEWIITISSYDIVQSNLSGAWRPMLRWLKELIITAFEAHNVTPTDLQDFFSLKRTVQLQSLFDVCEEMEDLSKAFLLAAICWEVVAVTSDHIEEKTYGKITHDECLLPWETLLRRLRVLLLVSIRLTGDVNPLGTGEVPLTVKNASQGIFSTYYWIARDELSLSHDNQVLMTLESACLSSTLAFYPSTVDGDTPENKIVLLQSCRSHKRTSLMNPTGIANDCNSRPLLFYLRDHATCTSHLAAHRALILGNLWRQTPDNMSLLASAIKALHIIIDETHDFTLATLVEFYQTRIRPIWRGMMFGFHDAHDHSIDIFLPLVGNITWRSEFSSASKMVLSLLMKCAKEHKFDHFRSNQAYSNPNGMMWPPLRQDPFLESLTAKLHMINFASVDIHHSAIIAHELTSISSLESIFPSLSSLFLTGSLFSDIPSIPQGTIQQYQLIDRAIEENAAKSTQTTWSRFDLGDIEIVAKSVGINVKYVRTRFFIDLIRLGSDASIEDNLAANTSQLDKPLFLNEFVRLMCERLHRTFVTFKRSKSFRGIVTRLDAESTRWIREEAGKGQSSLTERSQVSLVATHSLLHRVQSMMCKNDADEALLKKLDALCLLSGSLLKAVQAQDLPLIDV